MGYKRWRLFQFPIHIDPVSVIMRRALKPWHAAFALLRIALFIWGGYKIEQETGHDFTEHLAYLEWANRTHHFQVSRTTLDHECPRHCFWCFNPR